MATNAYNKTISLSLEDSAPPNKYVTVVEKEMNKYLDELVDMVGISTDKLLEDINTVPRDYKTPKTFVTFCEYINSINTHNNRLAAVTDSETLRKAFIEQCSREPLANLQKKYLYSRMSLADINQQSVFMHMCNKYFNTVIQNVADTYNIYREVMYLTTLDESLFNSDNSNAAMYNSIKLMTANISREPTDNCLICTTYKATGDSRDARVNSPTNRLISIFDHPSIVIYKRKSPTKVLSIFIWTYDPESPEYLFDKYNSVINYIEIIASDRIPLTSPVITRYSFSLYLKMLTTTHSLSGLHEFCKYDSIDAKIMICQNSPQTRAKFSFNYNNACSNFKFDVSYSGSLFNITSQVNLVYKVYRHPSNSDKMLNPFTKDSVYYKCPYSNTYYATLSNKSANQPEDIILNKILQEIYYIFFDSFRQLINKRLRYECLSDPFTMSSLVLYSITGAFNESCTALLKARPAQFDTQLPNDVYLYSLDSANIDIGNNPILRMVDECKPKVAPAQTRAQKKKSNKK